MTVRNLLESIQLIRLPFFLFFLFFKEKTKAEKTIYEFRLPIFFLVRIRLTKLVEIFYWRVLVLRIRNM